MIKIWMLLSVALSLGALLTGARSQDSELRWLTDLEAANELAADSGRPLLIVFR